MKESEAGTFAHAHGKEGSLLCGRSYWGEGLVCRRAGNGRTSLLFSGDLGGGRCAEGVLNLFFEELSMKARTDERLFLFSARALFSARSIYVLPRPNPDARRVKYGELGEDSPFYEGVKATLSKYPAALWCANGRGIDPARNFNHRFAEYKSGCPLRVAPFGCCGAYPESEPESAALARLMRSLKPRLFLHLTHGKNALYYSREHFALHALCTRYAPFEWAQTDLRASPEGWAQEEMGAVFLRISVGEEDEKRVYSLLRPLLFALCGY